LALLRTNDHEDLRRLPVEGRKAGLAGLLRSPHSSIALNDVYQLGCEGIVSKRLGSAYTLAARSNLLGLVDVGPATCPLLWLA
jgi:ATP-dependent DNA ligase